MNSSYYMSENLIPHTLDSFLSDLVEIRRKNGVTLDDIRVRTKVYPHIIAQFEQDGLNEHPLFNVLYLKAFVRSYADVVGISPGVASQSYADALEGKYDRRLAVEYLDFQPSTRQPSKVIAEEENSVADIEERVVSPGPQRPRDDVHSALKLSVPGEVRGAFQGILATLSDQFRNVARLGGQGIFQWGIMAAVLVLGVFLLFKLVSTQNESRPLATSQEPLQSIQETSVTQETEDSSGTPEVDPAILEKSNLAQAVIDRIEGGDSLKVTVVAAYGKLDPFRAKVDRDLRRPYWLDEGDSLEFWFSSQVTVEDNLDMMQLLFEGVEYEIVDTDSSARVVINRESANAFMYSSLQ